MEVQPRPDVAPQKSQREIKHHDRQACRLPTADEVSAGSESVALCRPQTRPQIIGQFSQLTWDGIQFHQSDSHYDLGEPVGNLDQVAVGRYRIGLRLRGRPMRAARLGGFFRNLLIASHARNAEDKTQQEPAQ